MSEHDESTPDTELDAAEVDTLDGVEDFDAYWSSQDRKGKRVRIMGQVVTLPPAIPLQFEMELKRLARSRQADDVRKLVGILFGPEALEQWAEAGMDAEQFELLLAWAPQVIAGRDVTLGEVAEQLAERNAKAKGKGGEPDPT